MADMVNFADMSIFDWISWACILGGAFFSITGSIGILRLPNVYSRMHGAGMVDTLGIGLIIVGLMFQADEWIVLVKLVLILVFIFFTAPTTTFALARAASNGGVYNGPHHRNRPPRDQKKGTPSSNT